jgi:hypothetical protein
MSECEYPLGDKLHEIIRAMICREIDTIFDSMEEFELGLSAELLSITKQFDTRINSLETKLNTAVASNKRLNQQVAEYELELYDLKYKKEKV